MGSDQGSATAKQNAEPARPGQRGGMSRRTFIGRSAGTALAVGGLGGFLSACGAGGGSSNEVVVMAWSVYVTPDIQKAFHEATGLTLKAIPADDDQSMFTKLKAGGGAQYDIVFANCGWAPIYRKNGLTEVLDLTAIDASKNLAPIFKENTTFPYIVEPNKVLLYPNMWGAAAMIWNTSESWQPSEPYSWSELWQAPKGKVILHGASQDFLAMAGLSLGVPREKVYSMNGDTLARAAKHLADLKPFQISPNSDAVTARAIASGKAYAGFASSLGVAYKANKEFAGGKQVARTVIPKEGTLGWVDGPQLVKNAKNRKNALKFLEFWGANDENQRYLWDKYYFAQCSQTSTDRVVKGGGESARLARSLGADTPDLAEKLTFLAPPDDPQAWTQAYDGVVGS